MESPFDIVSEWIEPISEEELDELAEENCTKGKFVINDKEHFSSRKEATLAAIDAALEYLENRVVTKN